MDTDEPIYRQAREAFEARTKAEGHILTGLVARLRLAGADLARRAKVQVRGLRLPQMPTPSHGAHTYPIHLRLIPAGVLCAAQAKTPTSTFERQAVLGISIESDCHIIELSMSHRCPLMA